MDSSTSEAAELSGKSPPTWEEQKSTAFAHGICGTLLFLCIRFRIGTELILEPLHVGEVLTVGESGVFREHADGGLE